MKKKELKTTIKVSNKHPRWCPNRPCKTCTDLICITSISSNF